MFNELRRYVLYKVHYPFDSVCEAAYEAIFIGGICLLLAKNSDFRIFHFFLFFTATSAILSANHDLEYEIRTAQVEHLHHSIRSFYTIYSLRALGYVIYSMLLFVLASVIISLCCNLNVLDGTLLTRSHFILAAVHYGIFYIFYLAVIALTLRYERISVAVNFVYTCFLAYSGLVFPLSGVPTYLSALKSLLFPLL